MPPAVVPLPSPSTAATAPRPAATAAIVLPEEEAVAATSKVADVNGKVAAATEVANSVLLIHGKHRG